MGHKQNSQKKTASRKAREAAIAKQKRKNRIIGWVCGILCTVIAVAAVVFLYPRHAKNDLNAQPSDIVDEGIVRVFLRSLDNPAAMGLTLDGLYTVDGDAGFRFDKGTEITVATDNGTLYLKAGGLTIDMGSSFRLVRHAPESETENAGGIYIHASEKNNLYTGDLYLTASGNGIDSILSVQVEDYLYGVVAYEMSNSFPLEALKAQAIAARTYVMRARQNNKAKAYDVVDTTADQVYKGFDSGLTNVIKAVVETRGIVGMVNGQFAQCYYTASNGGQIASTKQIWGGSVAYIEMKEDPYDFENPLSREKTAFLPKNPQYGSKLETALAVEAKRQIPDAAELRVDAVKSVSLSDPDISGSLMYKNVAFELELSKRVRELRSPDPNAPRKPRILLIRRGEDGKHLTEEVNPNAPIYVLGDWQKCKSITSVKLSTYKQLKNLLGIGINNYDYEVFYLSKADSGWNLTAKRFGHGVGMSQRGAQTMAGQYDKTAEEILSFYYPGLTWYSIDWSKSSLTPIAALPSSFGYARAKPTPKPTQQPLPELGKDEYYATVTASTLNVRTGPGTNNSIAALLYSGERVIVTGQYEDNWVSIKTVEFTGYVKGDYLKTE